MSTRQFTPIPAGTKFGRLTVVRFARRASYRYLHLVRCECGTEKEIPASGLRAGRVRSCGCLKRELDNRPKTHGHSLGGKASTEYTIWSVMKARCGNPRNPGYGDYGGRGIRVCERWKDFEAFLADMGPRPSKRHSLERVDNAKGYEPGNVKWALPDEQARNSRRNRKITFRGETLCLRDWATKLGIILGTLTNRLNRGWSVEAAFTTPVGKYIRSGRFTLELTGRKRPRKAG